jgi:DNA-binding NarL/FixJ family response regulator
MTVLQELSSQEAPLAARSLTPLVPVPPGISGQPSDQRGASSAKSSRSTKPRRLVPTVIIDKSALSRAGLAHVLSGGRFRIAAACSALCDLPEGALDNGPCLVLIGLDQGDADAILTQISALKAQGKDLHIVVLAEPHIGQLLAAIEAGADGYLIKSEITPQALVQSLEAHGLRHVICQLWLRTLRDGLRHGRHVI